MSHTAIKKSGSHDLFLELVRRFPLRPIRNRADYRHALEIATEFGIRADKTRLNLAESDYADVLSHLIRDYDEQHSSILKDLASGKRSTPVEMLKFLMEQHGMNTTSLGKLVGGSGQASMILRGKRQLSKANIRVLSKHFSVSPELFF